MNDIIIGSYVTGMFGILLAFVSLALVYKIQIKIRRAEEAAKQTEAIRVKALESIGVVAASLGRISELLRWNIELEEKLPSESVVLIKRLKDKLDVEQPKLLDAYLTNLLFIDRGIGREILDMHKDLGHFTITIAGMSKKKEKIDNLIERLYQWCNQQYLNLATDIENVR